MTDEIMTLRRLMEKSADADWTLGSSGAESQFQLSS